MARGLQVMGIGMIASQALHLAAALAFGYLVLLGYRDIRRRSTALGAVVALAILIRILLGVSLFSISYLELPIARSLQLTGGFWTLAIDATGYFQYAAHAVDTQTMAPFGGSIPSPFYVNALAFWMLLVGVSPAAGAFLNLCLYIAVVVALIRVFRPSNEWFRDLPCIVAVAAYSFSPGILFSGTQPIKDDLSLALTAMACLGVLALRSLFSGSPKHSRPWNVVSGTAMICGAIIAMGGLRWYFGVIIWCTLALLLAVFTFLGRRTPLLRYLASGFLILTTAWLSCWAGADRSMRQLAPDPMNIAEFPSELMNMAKIARFGFLSSGGSSNIVMRVNDDPASGQSEIDRTNEAHRTGTAYTTLDRWLHSSEAAQPTPARPGQTGGAPPEPTATAETISVARAIPVTLSDQFKTVGMGLGLLFVPTPLLTAVLGVEIAGSRALMLAVNLDTLFMDFALLAVTILLWKRRHLIGDRLPLAIYGLLLSGTTALLIGYVITNFGTLWRMRSLVAIPLWVAVVALSPRGNELGDRPDDDTRQSSMA